MALKLIAKDKIVSLIEKAVASVGKGRDDVHAAAVQTMLHIKEHGDYTLAQRLVDDLNGMPGFNVKGLMFWYGQFAPLTARNQKFDLLEKKSAAYKAYITRNVKEHGDGEVAEKVGGRLFWTETADANPFWSLKAVQDDQAQVIPNVSTAQLMGRVIGMGKLLDKAIADKRFGGDEELARKYVKGLADFNKAFREANASDILLEQDTLAEVRQKAGITTPPTNQQEAIAAEADAGKPNDGGEVTIEVGGLNVSDAQSGEDDKRTGTEG